MDRIKWLHDIYPEILSSQELPIIVPFTQCIEGNFYNEESGSIEWEMGSQKAIINIYDNTKCLLWHSPHKNISRNFK